MARKRTIIYLHLGLNTLINNYHEINYQQMKTQETKQKTVWTRHATSSFIFFLTLGNTMWWSLQQFITSPQTQVWIQPHVQLKGERKETCWTFGKKPDTDKGKDKRLWKCLWKRHCLQCRKTRADEGIWQKILLFIPGHKHLYIQPADTLLRYFLIRLTKIQKHLENVCREICFFLSASGLWICFSSLITHKCCDLDWSSSQNFQTQKIITYSLNNTIVY